ncbi:putative toxin-antitoxin system toxin component, PIN family [Algoriphagus alkaliphilus]|uniref:Putative toxin-antitoxin system toxin component, PIN family n=1 Tax=Algoriphagus alkaliphilus TaxID=279824 RepID=A0A1G5VV65_9BACT|nr:putative toxin-antitoxin system toxin component, PIN family [Algoriphagus alkaliphilus]SDA48915.1 putative toxin-antitoxin system toxin component, PIN family [Algoriphagus alkaliphilus]
MRIVIDTNIAFSAILNSNSKIGRIILHPKTNLNFYSTHQLLEELEEHKTKLKLISGYSDSELDEVIRLITQKIRFINIKLIPIEIFAMAETIVGDIDIDDTEFVALSEHAKAKLWTGDKKLIAGLAKKNWKRLISTDELFLLIQK